VPVEPAPSAFAFPPASVADPHGFLGVGADLEPGTMLAAYRSAIFPMPINRRGQVGWWSPDPRGILPPARMHVSRSLRRALPRFEIRVDAAFDDVVRACADPSRPHGWISPRMRRAYLRLHDLGWAHSVEAWADGRLAGGVFGVSIGGLFAGESMFHHERDASKAALAAVCGFLSDAPGGERLFDVQWTTPHLCSLGAIDVPRAEYEARLAAALRLPPPEAFGR
jgi:leucyl/phenylalanyl-tRNA--protein transferase